MVLSGWHKFLLYMCILVAASGFLFKRNDLIPRTRRSPIRYLNPKLPATLSPQSSAASFKIEMAVPKAKAAPVKMIEDATPVYPDSILEFYQSNDIMFGNVMGKSPNSNSVSVRLCSGDVTTIDVAQIVSVWNALADEAPPTTTRAWKNVLSEADAILANIPERKRDLSDFWELTGHQRSKNMPVDSFDVGVYLFQESKMRAWMSPMWKASESKVCSLSAAERIAAAMLMHRDHFHFKRRVTKIAPPPTDDQLDTGGEFYVVEGGYKLVTESVLDFKECDTFVRYYLAQTGNETTKPRPFPSNSVEEQIINRILCTLETYALGKATTLPSSMVKSPFTGKIIPRRGVPTVPQVPKAVRGVLNLLKLPVTKASARAVLMNLGHHETDSYTPTFKKLIDAPREEILRGNNRFLKRIVYFFSQDGPQNAIRCSLANFVSISQTLLSLF